MQNHEKLNFSEKCKIPENVFAVKNVKSRIFVTVKKPETLANQYLWNYWK